MDFIISLFSKWGVLAVFILIILEYACFPLPSEVILPFAGFIAKSNDFNLIGVILLSIIGGYIGCLVCYLIGYYGGNYLYNKIYDKFKGWRKGLDKSKEKFNRYGNVSVFVCRIIPLCRTYISFFSGLFKQNLFKYSFYSILGITIWNVVLITLGFLLADNWQLIANYYEKYKFLLIIFAFILVLFFLFKKIFKNRRIKRNSL